MHRIQSPPEIELEALWYFEGSRWGQGQPSPASQRLAARIKDEALSLATPVAYYDIFPVQDQKRRKLSLSDGLALTGGLVTHILGKAREVAVVICTIGTALDQRAAQYFETGQPAHGYLLDRMGNLILGTLAEHTRAHLEAEARERGWQASTPISPGHADWSLSEQRILFQLIPSSETGVTLTPSYVMQPGKSVSMVVGFGPEMITHQEGSQCEYCSLRKTCTYRRLPGEDWFLVTPNDHQTLAEKEVTGE